MSFFTVEEHEGERRREGGRGREREGEGERGRERGRGKERGDSENRINRTQYSMTIPSLIHNTCNN